MPPAGSATVVKEPAGSPIVSDTVVKDVPSKSLYVTKLIAVVLVVNVAKVPVIFVLFSLYLITFSFIPNQYCVFAFNKSDGFKEILFLASLIEAVTETIVPEASPSLNSTKGETSVIVEPSKFTN